MYGEINLVIKRQDAWNMWWRKEQIPKNMHSKGFANAQFIYNLNLKHNNKKLRQHLISESKEDVYKESYNFFST